MLRRDRRGFTLLEVLVALALSGFAVLGARGVLDALSVQARTTLAAARSADETANATALLHRAFADFISPDEVVPALTGNDTVMTFNSWCDTARGWLEPCARLLEVQRHAHGVRVVLRGAGTEVALRDSLQSAVIRYLESPELGGIWRVRWEGTVMIPAAVGIIMNADTLLAPIGARR